jgi:hypothetical protein
MFVVAIGSGLIAPSTMAVVKLEPEEAIRLGKRRPYPLLQTGDGAER